MAQPCRVGLYATSPRKPDNNHVAVGFPLLSLAQRRKPFNIQQTIKPKELQSTKKHSIFVSNFKFLLWSVFLFSTCLK